jgi:cell division protein FtsA
MRSGYYDGLAAGIVLTGGATAMEGIAEVAENVAGVPTRRGMPTRIGGLVDVVRSPAYATGVGLVHYGAAHGRAQIARTTSQEANGRGIFRRMFSRLGEMF